MSAAPATTSRGAGARAAHPRPYGKAWRKYLIKTGYSCNNYCSFCHTEDLRELTDDGAKAVLSKILAAKAAGAEMAVLTGGEPTIRKDLFTLTGAIHKLGMKLGLVTNGRLLSVPEAFARFLDHGLGYTFISLHGATPGMHNRMVVANAYKETLGGIEAVARYNQGVKRPGDGIDLTVNCVVTRMNAGELRAMVDLLKPLGPLQFKLSVMEPKGGGLHNFGQLSLPPAEAVETIRDTWQYASETCQEDEIRIGVDGTTPCQFPGLQWVQDDLFTHGFIAMSETFEDRFHPVDHGKKFHPDDTCRNCGARSWCPGIPVDADRDLFTLQPLPSTIPNSLNFFLSPPLKNVEAVNTCELGLSPLPPETRGLWVLNGQTQPAYTDTGDFSLEEIKTLLGHGQIYLNQAARFLGVRFDEDLQKLSLAQACQTCSEKPSCTGAWKPVAGEVFRQADQSVETILSGLTGDVLEIGAGPDPYARLLKDGLETGRIATYLCLEPERVNHPLAGTVNVRILPLPFEAWRSDKKFGHILLLRSLNHLAFPEQAVRTLVHRLNPGGVLTLVENTAFAMVRPKAQKKRQPAGEAARRHHEHYHNLRSEDILPWLTAAGLQIVNHDPIRPDGANQWLIQARLA